MNAQYIGMWINDDPAVIEFKKNAKNYYIGTLRFEKIGKKLWSAKLDVSKLRLKSDDMFEVFFDIVKSKTTTTFYMRITDYNNNTTTTKLN